MLTDVELLSGTPRSLKVTLEVARSTAVGRSRGRQPARADAVDGDLVDGSRRSDSNLPLITRNALNFVVFLPGVDTGESNHSQRSSTVSGLPQSALSITVDGANIQDKYTRSTRRLLRQHPSEARPDRGSHGVDGDGHGATRPGQGAVQIKFATRSGTNTFTGSAYEYHRDRGLNTNYYFNSRAGLPKNELTLNQWGVREGGPIVIPGVYDGRGKAFFFFNFEQLRFPLSNTPHARHPRARRAAGHLPVPGAAAQTVNLLHGRGRAPARPRRPIRRSRRSSPRSAPARGRPGIINDRTDPNTQDYLWQPELAAHRQLARRTHRLQPLARASG